MATNIILGILQLLMLVQKMVMAVDESNSKIYTRELRCPDQPHDADRSSRIIAYDNEWCLMNDKLSTIAGIIGGLLVALLLLPISFGGTGSALFWLLFWLLLLALAASIYYAMTNRHPRHKR